jgi:hypothetical protein
MRQHLLQNKNMSSGKMNLEQKFNAATALVYTGEDAIQECRGSSTGFHCDTIWNAPVQPFGHLAILYELFLELLSNLYTPYTTEEKSTVAPKHFRSYNQRVQSVDVWKQLGPAK